MPHTESHGNVQGGMVELHFVPDLAQMVVGYCMMMGTATIITTCRQMQMHTNNDQHAFGLHCKIPRVAHTLSLDEEHYGDGHEGGMRMGA